MNNPKWKIATPEWRDEVLLIREIFDCNMPDAVALLNKYGSAEDAVNWETYHGRKPQTT